METRRDVFHAISDPTRREIIHMLAGKSQNLNSIAEKFDISRQAISIHIKVLNECGLIEIVQNGRERQCHAKLQNLNEVYDWVGQYRSFWNQQFKSLEGFLQKQSVKQKRTKRKKA